MVGYRFAFFVFYVVHLVKKSIRHMWVWLVLFVFKTALLTYMYAY